MEGVIKDEIVKILSDWTAWRTDAPYKSRIDVEDYPKVAEEIMKLFVVDAVAPLENHLPSCDCICCKPELWKKDDRGIWYQSIGDDVV